MKKSLEKSHATPGVREVAEWVVDLVNTSIPSPDAPPWPMSYYNFVHSIDARFDKEDLYRDLELWHEHLKTFPGLLEFVTERGTAVPALQMEWFGVFERIREIVFALVDKDQLTLPRDSIAVNGGGRVVVTDWLIRAITKYAQVIKRCPYKKCLRVFVADRKNQRYCDPKHKKAYKEQLRRDNPKKLEEINYRRRTNYAYKKELEERKKRSKKRNGNL